MISEELKHVGKMISKKIFWRAIIGLLIIILLLSLHKCKSNRENKATQNALTSQITTYKLKNNQLVTSSQIAKIEKSVLKEQIIKKDAEIKEMASKFSKVTAIQKIKTTTTIPKTTVAFDKPITKEDITPEGVLEFKRNGAYFSKWYEFGYVVTQDSLTIEPFNTWTEIKRVDGFKRKWILGKNTYHSDITFTNPYINTDEVLSYEVQLKVPWYQSKLAYFIAGAVTTYYITK
jgi:competence protein ComGC